ncbi:TOBE domain-containing protein [Methylobacterium sp. JK268]
MASIDLRRVRKTSGANVTIPGLDLAIHIGFALRMNVVTGAAAEARGARTIGIRAEHLALSPRAGEPRGVAGISEHLGSDAVVHVRLPNGAPVTARAPGDLRIGNGEPVCLTPDAARIHRFDGAGAALR